MANSLKKCSLLAFLIFPLLNCTKTVVENPFRDLTILDCRNLIVRDVTLKDSIINVKIENTCRGCDEGAFPVYLQLFMISRQWPNDTLASFDCLCLSPPRNGIALTYTMNTKLTTLPDLKTVKFAFDFLCEDMAYLPK